MISRRGAGLTSVGIALVRRAPFLVNAALAAACRGACFHSSFQVTDTLGTTSRSKNKNNGDDVITPETLQSRLQDAGVAKIAFLRHGKTAPAMNGVDFDRLLTDEGRQQAKDAGRIMAKYLLPFYPRCLVSPAPRTMETAQLFFQAAAVAATCTNNTLTNPEYSSASIPIKLEPIPILYDGVMQPEGSRLFRQLGYAPLSAYLHHSDTNDRNAARTVLGEYASHVAQALSKELFDSSQVNDDPGNSSHRAKVDKQHQQPGTTLCVVGHAIYLPAAALGVAALLDCCDPESEKVMLSTNTREAEGYLINLQRRNVTYLSRIENCVQI
jgi:Histidine phosphatase superfamily (branch 1)